MHIPPLPPSLVPLMTDLIHRYRSFHAPFVELEFASWLEAAHRTSPQQNQCRICTYISVLAVCHKCWDFVTWYRFSLLPTRSIDTKRFTLYPNRFESKKIQLGVYFGCSSLWLLSYSPRSDSMDCVEPMYRTSNLWLARGNSFPAKE